MPMQFESSYSQLYWRENGELQGEDARHYKNLAQFPSTQHHRLTLKKVAENLHTNFFPDLIFLNTR